MSCCDDCAIFNMCYSESENKEFFKTLKEFDLMWLCLCMDEGSKYSMSAWYWNAVCYLKLHYLQCYYYKNSILE